ncbi:hypothetical protein LWC35_06125 [Pseudonocardia kujensis]|uniref:hypothetical protein n=1 Tax=Pseudonocardia kujensis TaxID=1128675 RepID=UPI001E4EEBA0|nr:hypothetical protein [Pseudonocardia kujensis]MCE0762488.1 hypothetical protein [Pseudonocardia kujensis]
MTSAGASYWRSVGFGFAYRRGRDDAPDLEAIYRGCKIGETYEGANEIQKWAIAGQIFGRDITG